jgi:hypothetical protein
VAQIIVECAAPSIHPLIKAISSLTRSVDFEVSVLHSEDVKSLQYKKTDSSLGELIPLLQSGQSSSLILTPRNGQIRSFVLYAPNLFPESLSIWHLFVDYSSWVFMDGVRQICEIDGLRFVSAALENSLDLSDQDIDKDEYPWGSRELILVASSRDCRARSWRARRGSCQGLPSEVLRAVDDFVNGHEAEIQ